MLSLDNWDLIVDVGANYGEMLLEIDDAVQSHTVAFEANRLLIPYLERSLNEARRVVTIEQLAVSDKVGSMVLHLDETWSGTSSIVAPPSTASGHVIRDVEVSTTTLDAYFASTTARRACIKVDVEGAEELVLNGGQRFFAQMDVCAVMMEIAHLPAHVVGKIARDWRLYLMDRRSHAFIRVDADILSSMCSFDWHYQQDAVLVSPSSTLALSYSDAFPALDVAKACALDLSNALSAAETEIERHTLNAAHEQTRVESTKAEVQLANVKLVDAETASAKLEAEVEVLKANARELLQGKNDLQNELAATRATRSYRLATKINRLLGRVR